MKKGRDYFVAMRLLVQATTSYFIKFYPYKTVWTTFVISFVIMLMPYIVQAIIKGLDGLDDRWRVKQCLEKERKREIFKSI